MVEGEGAGVLWVAAGNEARVWWLRWEEVCGCGCDGGCYEGEEGEEDAWWMHVDEDKFFSFLRWLMSVYIVIN